MLGGNAEKCYKYIGFLFIFEYFELLTPSAEQTQLVHGEGKADSPTRTLRLPIWQPWTFSRQAFKSICGMD